MRKLRVLDLFSGIGGFSLGLERTGGFETIAFCEYEDFPRRVLAKHWPDVPCFPDVRELKGSDIDGPVDVICGGYPCQPFSTAGKRLGKEDDRHLWPEFARLVKELRPVWVIGENVAGHVSMGLDDVLSDLESLGYTARPFIIPAVAVDAKHRRDRVWTVAHCDTARQPASSRGRGHNRNQQGDDTRRCRTDVADSFSQRGCGGNAEWKDASNAGQSSRNSGRDRSRVGAWLPEPNVGRVANGVPNRVDRLKALGNAVVPQIPEMIGYAILAAMQEQEAA